VYILLILAFPVDVTSLFAFDIYDGPMAMGRGQRASGGYNGYLGVTILTFYSWDHRWLSLFGLNLGNWGHSGLTFLIHLERRMLSIRLCRIGLVGLDVVVGCGDIPMAEALVVGLVYQRAERRMLLIRLCRSVGRRRWLRRC
jgi:hypothetical protein